MSRLLSLPLLGALCVSAACFSERLPPPTFRNDCSDNGDCGDDEACMGGLCEVTCTAVTADAKCDQSLGFVGCFNGACASVCTLGDEPCPGEQSCTNIPLVEELVGPGIGVCMQECTETSCPEGEACVQGFCATTCEPSEPASCGPGLTCLVGLGVCVPDEVAESAGGGDTMTETETETETETDGPGDTDDSQGDSE